MFCVRLLAVYCRAYFYTCFFVSAIIRLYLFCITSVNEVHVYTRQLLFFFAILALDRHHHRNDILSFGCGICLSNCDDGFASLVMSCVFNYCIAPAILPILYNVIKPFLAEYTRSKIHFMGSKYIVQIY